MIAYELDYQKLANWGAAQWRWLRDELRAKETIWQECWLAYDSKFGKTWSEVKQYRSRRYLPFSFQAVESITSHMVQGLMPHDDWFNVMGRTPDDDATAKYNAALMKWQHYRANWRKEIAKGVKQAAIFGCFPWAVLWDTHQRLIPDVEAHAQNLGLYAAGWEMGEEPGRPPSVPLKPVRVFDGPVLKIGNIFDYAEDRRPNESQSALRVMRSHKSLAYLRKMAEPDPMTGYVLYENLDAIRDMPVEMETSDALRRQVDAAMGFVDTPKAKVELLEFHGDFEVDGELLQNHILTIANRSQVIRFEPNPYCHGKSTWNLASLYEDPFELYGKGALEPILGLQDAANCFFNQAIEARALIVNPMLEVVNDGLLDAENFQTIPGAIQLVNMANTIRPIVQPDTGAIAMNEVGFLSAQINDITGSARAFTTADYQKSATEVSQIAGMTNSRFAESIRHLESTFLLPALQMQLELNQQIMDEEVWIRVVEPGPMPQADPMTGMPIMVDPIGPAQMKIAPEDIRGMFDIYPVGASWVANNQQQIAQMIQATQIVAQSPAAGVIKWDEFTKALFEKLGVREAYKFIKSRQEIAYEQYQAALAQQSSQAMGGPEASAGDQRGAGSHPGESRGGGAQSVPGSTGAPIGGGAGTGAVEQTNGGPQRVG